LDTVLNLQLDISIDGQLLKAMRDRAVSKVALDLAYN
jgi:hypothetical protein